MHRPVNLLRPHTSPRAGRVLLGLGALAMAMVLLNVIRLGSEREELESVQAQRKAAQSRIAEQRAAVAKRLDPAIVSTLLALDRSWRSALRSIEQSSQAPIFLLSLRLSTADDLVRLEGEAPSIDQALEYLGTLNDSQGIQRAALLSHVLSPRPNGESAIRFVAEARVQRRAP